MGATVQWRGEHEREPARYGRAVTFGNLRDRCTGYMSYSDRAGPGIVVLGGSAALCDRLTEEGFTALAPDLTDLDETTADRVVAAAVDHLLDNWHPRVGVLSFEGTHELALRVDERRGLDAVVGLAIESDVDEDVLDDLRYDLS